MQQSIRPVTGAITSLAMMRIRFSSPHKVHGLKGQVVVQAEEQAVRADLSSSSSHRFSALSADLLSRAQAAA